MMTTQEPANHRSVTSLVVFKHFARSNSSRFDSYLLAYSGSEPVGFWFIAPNAVGIPDALVKPMRNAPRIEIRGGQTVETYLDKRLGAGIDFYSWHADGTPPSSVVP